MSIATTIPARMTADGFFELKNLAHPGKVELVNGQLRMQHYASGAHATIQATLARLIGNHLVAKRPGWRVATEGGVQTTFDAKHNVRRPDLTVTCSPHTKGERALPSPVLLIQVMSPNNPDDQWETIRALANIGSVREIMVVDAETIDVQVFHRDDPSQDWPTEPVRAGAGGTVHLAALDLDLAVADIYWATALD